MFEVDEKLEKAESERLNKNACMEELKDELMKVRTTYNEYQKLIASLRSVSEPMKVGLAVLLKKKYSDYKFSDLFLQDAMNTIKRKQQDLQDNIDKVNALLANMQSKLKAFESTYEEARLKVESEMASAAELTSVRVPVTK